MKTLSFNKIFLGGIVLTLLLAGVWIWGWMRITSQKSGETLPVLSSIENFSLIERNGYPVDFADLKGHIWVADFIFTSCPGPCPIMTSKMSQLQTAFSYAKDVMLVSFSVDPERDTPEVLTRYADSYGADRNKWLFLTGDKEEIYRLARSSLKLTVREEEDPVSTQIIHSTRFVLIDKEGKIRGYYNSGENEALGKLVMDVERLRQEG